MSYLIADIQDSNCKLQQEILKLKREIKEFKVAEENHKEEIENNKLQEVKYTNLIKKMFEEI